MLTLMLTLMAASAKPATPLMTPQAVWLEGSDTPLPSVNVPSAEAGNTSATGQTLLPVWALPRLGVAVRNDRNDVRLVYGGRELRYSPARGWQSLGFSVSGGLRPPQQVGPSLHVGLDALAALGVPLRPSAHGLEAAAPAVQPVGTLPPSRVGVEGGASNPAQAIKPAQSTHRVQDVRHSLKRHRTVVEERVVLELSSLSADTSDKVPFYQVGEAKGGAGGSGVTVALPYAQLGSPRAEVLPSGHVLLLEKSGEYPATGAQLWLLTGKAGDSKTRVFTLKDPPRIVIDTVRYADRSVPPPPNPAALPEGVRLVTQGRLSLLSFDPTRYRPSVVSAPWGERRSLAALVAQAGGVAGINGGYFAMDSGKPVDLVVQRGQMQIGSLERRAALGISAGGDTRFGYPAPRYVLEAGGQRWRVNQMTPVPHPQRLTGWVGDGRAVGAAGYTTLELAADGAALLATHRASVQTQAGRLYFTFAPAHLPDLAAASTGLSARLDWGAGAAAWSGTSEALAAGPLLLSGGRSVLDPVREGFDTRGGIWRSTEQSAFGLLNGWPTLAHMRAATPEEFTRALSAAGFSDALRLDSGGSAAAYITGGYADLGGYLNERWGRDIANALVIVPR